MNDERTKGLLDWLDKVEFLTQRYAKNSKEDDARFDEIRALIEHGPEVDTAFIEKWARKITNDDWISPSMTYATKLRIQDLTAMLAEIPVTVKED